MARTGEQFKVVGRYMCGKEVTGYHLASLKTNQSGRFSKEQTAFLVGRNRVLNLTGQVYQDKMIFKGVGCNLDELPVKYEEPKVKKADNDNNLNNTISNDKSKIYEIIKRLYYEAVDNYRTKGDIASLGVLSSDVTRRDHLTLYGYGGIEAFIDARDGKFTCSINSKDGKICEGRVRINNEKDVKKLINKIANIFRKYIKDSKGTYKEIYFMLKENEDKLGIEKINVFKARDWYVLEVNKTITKNFIRIILPGLCGKEEYENHYKNEKGLSYEVLYLTSGEYTKSGECEIIMEEHFDASSEQSIKSSFNMIAKCLKASKGE